MVIQLSKGQLERFDIPEPFVPAAQLVQTGYQLWGCAKLVIDVAASTGLHT